MVRRLGLVAAVACSAVAVVAVLQRLPADASPRAPDCGRVGVGSAVGVYGAALVVGLAVAPAGGAPTVVAYATARDAGGRFLARYAADRVVARPRNCGYHMARHVSPAAPAEVDLMSRATQSGVMSFKMMIHGNDSWVLMT